MEDSSCWPWIIFPSHSQARLIGPAGRARLHLDQEPTRQSLHCMDESTDKHGLLCRTPVCLETRRTLVDRTVGKGIITLRHLLHSS